MVLPFGKRHEFAAAWAVGVAAYTVLCSASKAMIVQVALSHHLTGRKQMNPAQG